MQESNFFGKDAKIADLDLEVWNQTISVNLTGTFLTLKYAIRAMQEAGGSIIVTGSLTALGGEFSDFSAYATSKGGIHFTRHGLQQVVMQPQGLG